MSPKEYQQARTDPSTEVAMVDERPYFPRRFVDLEHVKTSVIPIVQDIIAATLPQNTDHSYAKDSLVERVMGGCTNTLFRVRSSNNALPTVLVRIFGAEGMIDRDVETSTYAALSQQGVAPGYWGRFGNGRVETWMDGMRALSVDEMPTYSTAIAVAVGHMHRTFPLPPPHLQAYHSEPSLWKQLSEWLDQAVTTKHYRTKHDSTRAASLNLSVLAQELKWLKETQIPPKAAIVFCHNDLLASNILLSAQPNPDYSNTDVPQVQFVDFEYGGMNYRTFEIANHFNEYAGGPPSITRPCYDKLPSLAVQRQFCHQYLTSLRDNSSVVTEPEVDELMNELQGFLLVNHLYWGLWAVNQAATEGCMEYDYMEYAMQRIQQYWIGKHTTTTNS